jgi:hypothetical protein
MAIDFSISREFVSVYAQENAAGWRTSKTASVCEESNEERACALLEISGRGCRPPFQRKNLRGM